MQDQLELLAVYGPFAWLARSLRVLVGNYVAVNTAHRIVRYVIADLVMSASQAMICPLGVYNTALDYASTYLAQELNVLGMRPYTLKDHDFEIPDRDRLASLCKAYAMIYECSYLGEWSYQDVLTICGRLRMTDILEVSEATLHQYVDWGDGEFDPIRRALVRVDHHDWGNELVCEIASDLRDSLVSRSEAWHRDVSD